MKVSSPYLLTHLRNKPSKSVMVGSARAGPGWAGPVHHGNGFYTWKQTFFVPRTMCLKSILSEICVASSYHMWPHKEALDCERHFASITVASNKPNYKYLILKYWVKTFPTKFDMFSTIINFKVILLCRNTVVKSLFLIEVFHESLTKNKHS